jgi:hypothetical protein
MAYVTPGTVAAGDVATAAAWNVITNDILQFAPFVQGVFTNEAARDAAITSPTEGMHAYITASTIAAATGTTTAVPTGIQTIYNGTNWVCVTPVGVRSNTSGTTTSTSYANSLTGDATAMSVTLVTGTTALIHHSNNCFSTPSGAVSMAFEVSGATTYAASDADRIVNEVNNTQLSLSKSMIFTGLTAGTNTFTLRYKVNANTATFSVRSLTAQGIA